MVDLDPNRLDLGLRLSGAADAPAVTVVLLGRVVIDAADGIGVEVEVPLVLADGSTVAAITGTPDGPVRLRGICTFDEATLAAEAIVHSGGGSFGLRLTGLVIDGNPVPPLELSSDAFDGDLTHTLTVLLNLAAAALGAAAGGAAQDVITHLPGVLGLAPDVPVLPFDELGRSPDALRRWLAGLATDDADGLRGWLTHVAGLAGIDAALPTGRPTPASPWRLPLLDDEVRLLIEVAVEPGTDGADLLDLGLRVAVDVPELLDASLTAAATVVRLPLAGAASADWFGRTRAELTVPSIGSTDQLLPPTGGFGLGRIRVGVAAEAGAVSPAVLLDDVLIDGRTYDRLDLSSAQALTSAGGQVLSDALDDLIGSTGFADDLLVLIGLKSPAGLPTIDLGQLATDPLGALRAFHLARLQGAGWAEPLEALGDLLGVAGATAQQTGPGAWRIALLDTAIGSLGLRATTTTGAGLTTLAVGLDVASAFSVDDGTSTQVPALELSADVLRVGFGTGPVGARGLDAIAFTVRTPGVTAGPLGTAGARLAGSWTAGAGGRVAFVLGDVVVRLPDPELGAGVDGDLPGIAGSDGPDGSAAVAGAPIELGDLTLPWAADAADPLAALGVPAEVVGDLLALAVRTLADWAGTVWAPVLSALADALPQLCGDAPDLNALLADLAGLGRTVLARLVAGAVAELDLSGLVGAVLGDGSSAGSGVAADPWSWVLDSSVAEVVAVAWTDGVPAARPGPESGDGPDLVSDEVSDDGSEPTFEPTDPDDPAADLTRLLTAAASSDPDCAASLAGLDPAEVAGGVLALADWVDAGDGLWTAAQLAPDQSWTTAITASGTTACAPFDDPDATGALADVLDGWLAAGTTLVAAAPAWWPIESWQPLLAALGERAVAAGRDPSWSAVDLRHDPTAALAVLTASDAYLVVATGNDPAHPETDAALTQALTRIAGLAPAGRQVLLAVGSTVASVASWATANAATVGGFAAVAAPIAADPAVAGEEPAYAADDLADAVRVLDTVFASSSLAPADQDGRSGADLARQWSALVGAWREAIDGQSVPSTARPAGVGRLGADFAAAVPAATVTALVAMPAAIPRASLTTGAPADLASAVLDAVGRLPADDRAASELRFGVRAPVSWPQAAAALSATATVTLGLGRVTLAAPAASAAPLRLELRLSLGADGPTGAGWLAGPPSALPAPGPATSVAVRRLDLSAWADLDSGGVAGAEIVLTDVRVNGTVAARCRRGDPGFDDALAAAVSRMAADARGGDRHARAVLGLLRDDLGLLDANNAVVAAAIAELLDDTAGWLAGQASGRLTDPGTRPPFLGLTADPTAAAGTKRWTRTLAPTLDVQVEHVAGAWTVTTRTLGDGIALGIDPGAADPAQLSVAQLGFTVVGSTAADTTVAWRLASLGAAVERDQSGVAIALLDRAPVRVWPVATASDGERIAGALLPYIPAALAAGFVSLLLAQLGIDVSPAGVIALVDRPVPELVRRLGRPGQLGDLVGTVADWLGIARTATGTVPLVDGVLELAAADAAAGTQLIATTPAGGWSPAAGLHLALSAGVVLIPPAAGTGAGTINGSANPAAAVPAVLPVGSATLTVDLPAAVQDAWTSLGIQIVLGEPGAGTPAGLAIRLLPQPGSPIELVPTFSGIGALAGQAAERLLPAVLNRLRDELPVGPARTGVLQLATAVGIYGTGFGDGPVALQDLSPRTLVTRAPQIADALVDLVADLFGVQAGAAPGPLTAGSAVTVAVAQDGGGLAIKLGLPPGITVAVSVDPTGPTAGIALGDLVLGPVTLGLEATGRLNAGQLQVSGSAQVDLDLVDPLRIVPGPSLRASLSAAGDLSVVLLPLGDALPASDASITLAPVPAIAFSTDAIVQFALSWLVVPGMEALVQLVGPALDTELGHVAAPATPPTLRSLLTGAGLLGADGHVVAPLPSAVEVLVGAAGSIASAVAIQVAPGLALHLAVDADGIGIALTGTVDLGGDEWKPSLLAGGSDVGSNIPGQTPEGLVLTVLRKVGPGGGLANSGWDLSPAITLDGVGAALTRTGGLVQTSIVTIDDVGAWLGTSFALDPATGHLTVDPLSGGIRLGGLGLPALSGGGGSNPVAGSLLGDADRNGAPINPPLDFDVIWTGTELRIDLKGTKPGETLWIQVGRTFGPLHIDRVGLRSGEDDYTVDNVVVHTSYIGVLVDGGLAIGPLSMAVQGLGLSIPPRFATRPSTWKVDLDGLSVDFSTASITIAGGLLKADIVVDGVPAVDYRGMLQVQAFGFGATALGAYSQVKRADGTTYASLFVFAAINAPIGGPPYLFITGLAGGFGVNRDFLPPSSVDAIGGFPLIAVMGELTVPADEVLANMGPSLPPRDGAYWIAAGITFSTFELLHTRALVYVAFNPQGFEIGLLGLMRAALPTADSPLISVELGLRARYSSVDQVFSVQAALTANSWLFSTDCRLTGGFAFVIWFARPQVVLTAGGYGPIYPVPDYFPQVAPLGFEWRFGDNIVIKGGTYFAITPEAMMAGGSLEVSAKGGWGHGSLELYVDAILWFHPARFEFQMGIRITGKAFGFGFDLSAKVYLRLPPVYGTVHVDFMWGFDFEFGTKELPPAFLDFADFFTGYVDGAGKPYVLRVLQGPAAAGQPEEPDGTHDRPFRALPEFGLDVSAKLPCRRVLFGAFSVIEPNPLFAVPMGPSPALDPTLTVGLVAVDDAGNEHALPAAVVAALDVTSTTQPVASALWAGTPQPGTVSPPSPSSLTGGDMRQVPSGIVLTATPSVRASGQLGPLAVGVVVDDVEPWGLPLDGTVPHAAPRRAGAAPPSGAAPGRSTDVAGAQSADFARLGVTSRVVDGERSGPSSREVAGAGAVDAGGVGAEAGEIARAESPRPVLRWSTARATGPGWRALALRPAETCLFDLAHHLPSPRLDVTGRARVLAVNLMGDVLSDVTAEGPVELPDRAAAVIVERAGERDRPIGWDLTTRLRPVTPWTYLADGAVVQLRRPAALGPADTDADGVAAHSLVRDRESCTTRLAAGPGWSVVVACDALSVDADPAGIAVEVDGGSLTTTGTAGGADTGRRHLVFSVAERAGATLDVTVTTGEGWSCAGVVAGPTGAAGRAGGAGPDGAAGPDAGASTAPAGAATTDPAGAADATDPAGAADATDSAGPTGADGWLVAFAESPWRSLFDPPPAAGPRPRSRRTTASTATTVRFSAATAPRREGTDG